MIPYFEYNPTLQLKPVYSTQGLIDAPVRVQVIDSIAYAVIQLPADYPIALLKNWIARIPKPATPQADSQKAVA